MQAKEKEIKESIAQDKLQNSSSAFNCKLASKRAKCREVEVTKDRKGREVD